MVNLLVENIYQLASQFVSCVIKKLCFLPLFPFLFAANFLAPCDMLDIIFILDISGSINNIDPQNWEAMRTFTKDFVSRYTISQNAVRVGVVLMGNNGVLKIQLNSNIDLASLLNAIDQLEYRFQKTNIKDALRVANDLGFATSNGNRANGYDVVVMITDGETQNSQFGPIGTETERLKNNGVEVFVIAHTYYKQFTSNSYANLQRVASAPLSTHYFEIGNFPTQLGTLIEPIQNQIAAACANSSLAAASSGTSAGMAAAVSNQPGNKSFSY